MFFGEFEYSVNERDRAPIPPRFRRELKERVVLRPGAEKRTTANTLPEWKKQVICNFLVKMRFSGLKPESAFRQQR